MKNSKSVFSSILIIALSSFFQLVKAQIVYTDVNPDQTFSAGQTYQLDLNNDGIVDFDIVSYHGDQTGTGNCAGKVVHDARYVSITTLNGNEFMTPVNSWNVTELAYADTIGSSGNWPISSSSKLIGVVGQCVYSTPWGYFYILGSVGTWDFTQGYIGLKIFVGGKTFYGWVRLYITSLTDSYSFTILDYAINKVQDQFVLAGQTCPPQAEIFPAGPISFCMGDSAILSSVNSGNTLFYQWKKDGANITGATNKTFTAKTAGKYKVKVTDNENGCTSTSSVVKVKTPCKVLSEELNDYQTVINIYPNPIQSSAIITLSLPVSQKITLEIFNVEGRLIRTLAGEQMSTGTHTITWNARDENGNEVSEGIYFLKMQTENEVKTIAISVVK